MQQRYVGTRQTLIIGWINMELKGPPLVTNIEHLGEGILRITFDGKTKDIDIPSLNLVKRYPKLKDPTYVEKAFFEDGCIKWPENGPWIDADELEYIPETTKIVKDKINVASNYRGKVISALRKVIKD